MLLFSRPVVSDSLRPHGLQHAKLLCPPLSVGYYLVRTFKEIDVYVSYKLMMSLLGLEPREQHGYLHRHEIVDRPRDQALCSERYLGRRSKFRSYLNLGDPGSQRRK